MIDNIKLTGLIKPPPGVSDRVKHPIEWKGLLFNPKYYPIGDVKEYYTFLDNLQLTIKEDELTITNSLQKYYHGHNYGDFTFEEVGVYISPKLCHPVRSSYAIFEGA
jgi:hypothetical protein